tara:strand:+ start:8197 stop:9852 length:1656 start_codon:yes stop_codon:yes gene_type:complete
MKKVKIYIIALVIGVSSWISYGFADNYFEISKNLDIFSSLIKELNTYYVDETEPGQLTKTAIDAMLESLDPYTNYIPESRIEDFKFMTTGQYGGIGALIHKDSSYIVISEPYEGFPAHKAGLKAGDQIIEVDGKSVEGKSTSEISDFLKGQPGTAISVTIKRPGSEDTFKKEVVREQIKVDDVPYYGMLNEEIGYIKLVSFTQTAHKEFAAAFKDLKVNKGMKQLIFDLRDNGGGLLTEAVDIVNVFIPRGKKVVETRGKLKEWDAVYNTRNEPLDTEIPVTILVNESSASASEIVAGTLQDYDRAVIIGKQTYGKGLVQQTRPLSYNAQLKVTVAKYYIPSGRCIQKVDYSSKDINGNAVVTPDSLVHLFKTLKSKRSVYDGKGIKPDLKTDNTKLGELAATLLRGQHIFDYATIYAQRKETISDPDQYKFQDKEYEDFLQFLEKRNFSYTSKSERMIEEFKKIAEKERYFDLIENEYKALEQKLIEDHLYDLKKFKDEISLLIENEIVSRYYFQNGRIKHSLSSDPDVIEALSILAKQQKYDAILAGTN